MTPTDRSRAADVAAFFDGARLTLGRQLAGLRKSDLAQNLEMSPTAVAAWESGAKRPTAVTVARLAALGALARISWRFTKVPHQKALKSIQSAHQPSALSPSSTAITASTTPSRNA